MDNATVAVFAPAKINLYLHVTGRRADGYHELESLVVFADVGDRIMATADDGLSLEITGPQSSELSAAADNLVLRAAEALRARVGGGLGARITLEKNLPVSSGIGGGSADAAAAIKALSRLWHIHPAQHDLSGLALDLGADVPVCLAGRTALMSGIGEQLTFVELPTALPAVMVNPGVAISTPAVFKARRGAFSDIGDMGTVPEGIAEIAAMLSASHNDLEAPAMELAPGVGTVLVALNAVEDCLLARMSGSGATCFGIFADESAASMAAATLRSLHPDWWIADTVLG
ncbi:MAG: 4-(cytidine 5'-diphospho)-2-C-methyl-D-erythritol kinase [Rhodospirillaceae bacterium]|jgi:4-diphosphocytidyl-2-C-methyl-D-erythritol kinase|nr:4-(cytidine 5'-diphospho)-2-C-methyl-D-erythritol kinase [Rhodospirillaceae bacterium]